MHLKLSHLFFCFKNIRC